MRRTHQNVISVLAHELGGKTHELLDTGASWLLELAILHFRIDIHYLVNVCVTCHQNL